MICAVPSCTELVAASVRLVVVVVSVTVVVAAVVEGCVVVASVVVGLGCFIAILQQFLVGDREFLRSMIPHHSGAVLMCKEASLKDPELRELCYGPNGIIASQIREVEQMKAILKRL